MQVLIHAILVLSLCIMVSSDSLSMESKRNLVPTRRLAHVEARDLWKRNIVPHTSLQLNYGLGPQYPPTAYVSCTAHDGHPILSLEEIDYLLDNVYCTATTSHDALGPIMMELVFSSRDAFVDAFETWTELESFFVVSLHTGCNAPNERAAWRVLDVSGDLSSLTVRLTVEPTPLHSIGKACRIEYSHMASGSSNRRAATHLRARDAHQYTNSSSLGFADDLDPRLVLWPLQNDSLIDADLQAQLSNLDLQLTCVDCSFNGNLSLGWDIEYTIANVSCLATNASCITLTKANFNVTVLEFAQSASLEVFIGDGFKYGANWTIFKIPEIPQLNFDGITVGPAAGVKVGFDVGIETSLNFTYGAKAQIPPGTFASLDLLDSSGNWNPSVDAKGWDQGSITQIPFRINSGQFDVTADLWLAPFAEIDFTIESFTADAIILAHTPMLTVDADLVTNVNRSCSPVGPEDFETFSAAFTVGADLSVGPAVHFAVSTGELGRVFSVLNVSNTFDDDFPGFTFTTPQAPTNGTEHPDCFVLSDGSQVAPVVSHSVPIAVASSTAVILEGPAATGTMFAAASAVPTWDFQKIESYSSANGHLPTNVNYQQMLQATTVPSQLLNSVQAASVSGSWKLAINKSWILLPLVFIWAL